MNWKAVIAIAFTFSWIVNARPGIRTPPARLLRDINEEHQETPTSMIIQNPTSAAGETPLVTNRRYLQKTVEVSPSRSLSSQVGPGFSEIGIFSEYKSSSNFVVNEFLRKNIEVLLNDRLPRRHLVGAAANNNLPNHEQRAYSSSYPNLKKGYVKNNQQQVITNWHKLKPNYEQTGIYPFSENALKTPFPMPVHPTNRPEKFHNQAPMVIITSRPIGALGNFHLDGTSHNKFQYYSQFEPTQQPSIDEWKPNTEGFDNFYSSTFTARPVLSPSTVTYINKLPSTFPYDPADPDPFYDVVSDSPLASEFQPSDPYGSIQADSSEKSESPPVEKTDGKCPGIKVTLNDKVSLNFIPDAEQCRDAELNVSNSEATTVTSNTAQNDDSTPGNRIPIPVVPPVASIPPVLNSAPSQVAPLTAEVPVPPGTFSAASPQISGGTQGGLPPIAGVVGGGGGGGGGGAGGGGHGGHKHKKKHKQHKHKHKHQLEKPQEHFGLAAGLKYMTVLFTKFFALFTIANPLTFSFWIMMFSPLAVLVAGGAGLAVIAYPFASAVLRQAYRPVRRAPSTIVIHRHRYPHGPKWKHIRRPGHKPLKHPRPWRNQNLWRRMDIQGRDLTSIPINLAHVDEVDRTVKMSIDNFRRTKIS